MAIKKIEEMDHYEILSIKRNASPQEIEKAYLIGKATYTKDSLAHYNLLDDKERQRMLDRIDTAFMILGNPEKRHAYDESNLKKKGAYQEKASFRRSTERMIIEDVHRRHDGFKFLKRIFSTAKKN